MPSDPAALERAQRATDRIKEMILRSAGPAAAEKEGGAKAAKPAAPAPRVVPRSRVAQPSTAPHSSPASPVRNAGRPAAPSSSSASGALPWNADAPLTKEVILFDFEQSTEGFSVHEPGKWTVVKGTRMMLSPQAATGKHALLVSSPQESWLGMDFPDWLDFSALQRVSWWMLSAQGRTGNLAIKSGSRWDWCELVPVAVETRDDGFVRYEAALKEGGPLCPQLDTEDIRGMHWHVSAGDTVLLDTLRGL